MDMSRPSDFTDTYSSVERQEAHGATSRSPKKDGTGPKLGFIGWFRWGWRQLTSMKTALILLLMLALAAIPGSLFPQRSADPNGVVQYYERDPEGAALLEFFQLFDVFESVWFSAIYVLLFVSLIGCILPRVKHHYVALTTLPPKAPGRLNRLPGYRKISYDFPVENAEKVHDSLSAVEQEAESTRQLLKKQGFRIRHDEVPQGHNFTGEKGYWRETGNLLFHIALVGVLVTMGLGGTFGYYGQRLLVSGQTFVNTLSAYDSFSPGRFFSEDQLPPFSLTMHDLDVYYEDEDPRAYGLAFKFTAHMTVQEKGQEESYQDTIRVNHPLHIMGDNVYLLGNGYAPTLTVKNPEGQIVWQDSVPFLPQDALYTSVGVVKIPDGLAEQVGMQGFFYPTQAEGHDGAYTSIFPDLRNPVLTLNVYTGDLGIDEGLPKSVYVLDTDELTQIAGRGTDVAGIELRPGETAEIPGGLGTISLDDIPRFISFDVHHNPSQVWILVFALTAIGSLFLGLLVPRRRVWVKIRNTDTQGRVDVEYAGIARGEDPNLEKYLDEFCENHRQMQGAGRKVVTDD